MPDGTCTDAWPHAADPHPNPPPTSGRVGVGVPCSPLPRTESGPGVRETLPAASQGRPLLTAPAASERLDPFVDSTCTPGHGVWHRPLRRRLGSAPRPRPPAK